MTHEDKFIIIQYLKHAKLIVIGLILWIIFSILIFNFFFKQVNEYSYTILFEKKILKPNFRKSSNNKINLPINFLLYYKDAIKDSINYDNNIEFLESNISVKENNIEEWTINVKGIDKMHKKVYIELFIKSLGGLFRNKLQKKNDEDLLFFKINKINIDSLSHNNYISKRITQYRSNYLNLSLIKKNDFIKLIHLRNLDHKRIKTIVSFFLTSPIVYFSIVFSLIYFFSIKRYHIIICMLLKESKEV